MDYFNPFAPPPAPGQDACTFSQVGTLVSELQQHGPLWLAERYVLHHGSFAGDARTFQTRVYQDAQSVIGQLNTAINAAASGLAKVISTDDFAGHDMCAHGTEWVFSPTAAVDLTLQLGSFVNQHVHLSAGGDEVCPDPIPSSSERNFRFYQQLDLRS